MRYFLITVLCMAIFAPIGFAGSDWDKTFPKSDMVEHHKVSFYNRLGIQLVADMYVPKNRNKSVPAAAILVGHPYGGVKEQSSGLYAQTMAELGFVTLAWDASYSGESGGQPRSISSPDAVVEDFSAAVDFIGTREFVDRNRIGVIGICASGGFSLAAAAIDPRIRAVATISMYDTGRARREGSNGQLSLEQWRATLVAVGEQRYAEFEGEQSRIRYGTPQTLPENASAVVRDYYDYYRTPRGQHPRSTTGITFTSTAAYMNFHATALIDRIAPRPLLFIAGEKAYSLHFSQDAYRDAVEPKELLIIPGASHVDLYDRTDLIPFDTLAEFFETNLALKD